MDGFIITVNIEELIHIMQQKGIARGYTYPINLQIPPSSQVTLDIPVQSGWLATPIEMRIMPDPDHALSVKIYRDGDEYYSDDDLVAGVYSAPIKYFKDYPLLRFARDKFTIEVTNSSLDTAYFNAIFVWVELKEKDWRQIVEKYYNAIAKAFGLED